MEKHRAARRLRPEDLSVPRGREAPRVAVLAIVLLERAAVRLGPHRAAAAGAERLPAAARSHLAIAIAMRRVDPAIEAPTQVVDRRMRVANAEPGVELRALVRHF